MFQPVGSKISFPQLESRILSFWKEHHIFERSVELRQGAKQFTLYEGPPTANGRPGIHHVLSRVFKDVIPRYRVMKGYYVPRRAGWDTHGLPVELEVEKTLGFTSKSQIEHYGVAQFNALCRESVFNYLKDWESMTERIGFWLDMEQAYKTLDNSYIESCWWALRQMWDKGLIFQSYRVTPHCPRCGTSLSSHEVALGYKDDAEDPSVYIKFKVIPNSWAAIPDLRRYSLSLGLEKPVFLLAWTTTPWTLPGNTALAVASGEKYSLMEGPDDFIVMASTLVGKVGLEGYVSRYDFIDGQLLVGLEYQPLFNPHDFNVERRRFGTSSVDVKSSTKSELRVQESPVVGGEGVGLAYHVISGDFVSMDEGTGIVHIAPAFGEVDFEVGQKNGLDFVQPVDLDGKVMGTYAFANMFVKDADPLILKDLKARGLLYRSERIIHTYPFCWRCDSPLLYYAKKTWYIRTSTKKDALIAGNRKINWYPEHIKHGRFGDWLANNVDWAFSRERYWGTPLNIWNCSICGGCDCVGSIAELKSKKALQGLEEPLDLHRPFVDNITFACSQCGGIMRRQSEVIDCWFDSGSMPFAQWHYPFEDKETFNRWFPADYICEAVDQTRGWFYSLHAISTLLFDRPCFENVICLGHILDANGEKMSKARGNVVDPWGILDKYGADALRWYLFTSSPPGNVRRFSVDAVADVIRGFLLTLWNTYSFFITYANIDHFEPQSAAVLPVSDLDNWILSELNQLVEYVDENLSNYDLTAAARRLESFVDDLSNWYVRRSRRRFWKSQSDADKLSAHATLYRCLVTLSKLLAPFTPFVAEDMYQNLVCSVDIKAPLSVHLTDFPVADLGKIDKDLIDATHLAMTVCSLGRSARAKAGIKVRQPLANVLVRVRAKSEKDFLLRLSQQILDELNVKAIEVTEKEIPENEAGYSLAVEGDYQVAVATELSPDLSAEGVARDVVRRLQNMRRSAGFDIADHVVTYYQGDSQIQRVMTQFADYIKQETLSRQLTENDPDSEAYMESFKIDSHKVRLGIKRVS